MSLTKLNREEFLGKSFKWCFHTRYFFTDLEKGYSQLHQHKRILMGKIWMIGAGLDYSRLRKKEIKKLNRMDLVSHLKDITDFKLSCNIYRHLYSIIYLNCPIKYTETYLDKDLKIPLKRLENRILMKLREANEKID